MIKRKFTNLIVSIACLSLVMVNPGFLALAQETTAENQTTGSDSTNTATNTENIDSTQTTDNSSSTDNTTNASADSGTNEASANTGSGEVTTSDASTQTSSETTTNTTQYDPMPYTTWTGEGDWQTRSQNNTTGSGSTNTASNDTNINSSTGITNDAEINNTNNSSSETGANTASNNTGDATITTGNASTITSTQNIANLTWTGDGDWTNLWNGEALNYLTGSSSDNEAANNFQAVIDVLIENGVDIENLINSSANSGGNTASDNTGSAFIQTGDAAVLATLLNLANTNVYGTDALNILYQDIYGDFAGNIDLSSATPYSLITAGDPIVLSSSNDTTGSNSDNEALNSSSLTVDIFNDNDGILDNNLDLAAITGANTASDNTGNATIQTGDAEVIANLVNLLNTNVFTDSFYLGVINVFGNWLGNLILPTYPTATNSHDSSINSDNSFTGSNSDNTTTNDLNSEQNIENENDAEINNSFDLAAETGSNTADDNTLSGNVLSGESAMEANIASWSNTNIVSEAPWWLVLINNLGVWTPVLINPATLDAQIIVDLDDLNTAPVSSAGQLTADSNNNMTGSNSDNTAENNLDLTQNITNQNNGVINNNIDALALTGSNNADRNTGNGSVISGDASVLANVVNFLNTNIVAPSFLLTIVNIFGSWNGDVLNAGATANIPSSQEQASGGTTVDVDSGDSTSSFNQPSSTQLASLNGTNPEQHNTNNNNPSSSSPSTLLSSLNINNGLPNTPQNSSSISSSSPDVDSDDETQVLSFQETAKDLPENIANLKPTDSKSEIYLRIAALTLLVMSFGILVKKLRGGVKI